MRIQDNQQLINSIANLPEEVRAKVTEYVETLEKAQDLQHDIFEWLYKIGIDTQKINFEQAVGDVFANSELEGVEHFQEIVTNYLKG